MPAVRHSRDHGDGVAVTDDSAAAALTRIADLLDDPEERKRIAKLCADKEAVVALIALMLRVGASSV